MAIDIGPFGKKKKKKDNGEDASESAAERRERRKKAREQAVGGYKREGGLLERLREGWSKFRGLGDSKKDK